LMTLFSMFVTISFFNKSPTTGMVAWSFRSSHGITSVPDNRPAPDRSRRRRWALHPTQRGGERNKERAPPFGETQDNQKAPLKKGAERLR
jgi:hypothetical protein